MRNNQLPNVTIYSKGYCPYCKMAKVTLKKLGLQFEEIDITYDTDSEREMRERTSRRTVPQIFVDDRHIGGNDDLQAAIGNGELEKIIQTTKAN